MVSEKLEISVHRIRVDYVFRNISAQDVNAVVAFPLPEVAGSDESPITIPSKDPLNFMSFKVTVDGKAVSPRLLIRAVLPNGKDVTERVRSLGLPLSVLDQRLDGAIQRLPDKERLRLEKDELLLTQEFEQPPGKKHESISPLWGTRVQFHWTQHFPAKGIVRVSHTYLPVVGGSYVTYGDDGHNDVSRYCGNGAMLKQIKDVKAKLGKRQDEVELWERNIKYILTTANNWKGPIEEFHLGINSDSSDDVVMTCMPLLRVSPTRYEMNASNFHPHRDLDLMILQPNR